MIDGDLLRQLFKSFSASDAESFRDAARALIQEERAKNHRLLADDLERLLYTGSGSKLTNAKKLTASPEIPRDRERDFPLVDVSRPDLTWDRLVIPLKSQTILRRITEENRRRDVLASAGLRPPQRLLFWGPPGCGKTLAGNVIAGVLGYPLVTVRFDAVVSSYLGETAANLRRVFEFVARDTFVVLFDEFDAIGKDRDNPLEHGELKRVVNSLLQLLDAARGDSLLVAATNHEGLLDSAVWRRFDAVVSFNLPTPQERLLLLRAFLRGFGGGGIRLELLARRLQGASGADIERVCVAAARTAVLAGRQKLEDGDFDSPLADFLDRSLLQAPSRSNSKKERTASTRAKKQKN